MRRWSLALCLLGVTACQADPEAPTDAGLPTLDAGPADAGPPPPFALRLEAAPASIEGRPWPSDHWRAEGAWRLPVVEGDEGFFYVTTRQITQRLDGYALRPVARFCFTQDLPLTPPPDGLVQLVDGDGVAQEITQLTLDRERRCLQYAAASPLMAGATYYSLLKQVEGLWSAVLLEGATPSEEPTAQRLASDASTLAAEPFTVQTVGRAIAQRRRAVRDGRAWSPEVSSLEVLRRTAIEDIAAGNRFGFEAGRRGLYLRLHVADFLADEEGQLILEDAVVLDRNRLSETSAVLVRAQETGAQRYAAINRDWSISTELEAPAGSVVRVFQELFTPVQSFAELDGGLEPSIDQVIHARVRLPVWRNELGLLAEYDEDVGASQGMEYASVTLYLPAGERPADGWPLVLLGPGYGGLQHDLWSLADQVCGSGMAAVVLDAVGHGGGPATSIQLPLENALPVEVAFPGRAVDGDADARYGLPEGLHASWAEPEFAGMVGMQDGNRQTALDWMALLTVLLPDPQAGRAGVDVDRDGLADFDAQRVHFVGHSNGGRYGMTLAAHDERLKRVVLLAPPGDGYIPFISSYRPTWSELFDTWTPPLTNAPSNRYGLFDEGILWPGAGLLDAPLAFHGVNRFTARKAWLGGDAEGEGAAALWRRARAEGAARAEVMVQLIKGDPDVTNPDSMRLVDAAGDELVLSVVDPDALGWRDSMRFADLIFRHLIPVYSARGATPPSLIAGLSRAQVAAYLSGLDELDLDGDEPALRLDASRAELRQLLGFSFWELRRLLRF